MQFDFSSLEVSLLNIISSVTPSNKERKINECLDRWLLWELEIAERKALGEKMEE